MILAAVADQRAVCALEQRALSPSFRWSELCDRAFDLSCLSETRPPKLPPCRGSGISRLREYHASPSVCEPVHMWDNEPRLAPPRRDEPIGLSRASAN